MNRDYELSMLNTSKDLSGQSNLAIRFEYQAAVQQMQTASKTLQSLPQDPTRPQVSSKNLENRLGNIGAKQGADATMFLAGAVLGGAQQAIAPGLSPIVSRGIDVAMNMVSERAQERTDAPIVPSEDNKGKKRGFKTESVYKPKYTRAVGQQMGAKPAGNSALQLSMTQARRRALQNTKDRRLKAERQLTEAESLAQVMQTYQRADVYDIYDSPEAKGQKVQTKLNGQLRLAKPAAINNNNNRRKYAPGMRLGMG